MAGTDINYINGLIVSLYKTLIPQDKLMRMAEADDAEMAFAELREQGYGGDAQSPRDFGKLLASEEDKLLSFIRNGGFDSEINAFCLAKKDYHNAECAVRKRYLGGLEQAFRPSGEYPAGIFDDVMKGKNGAIPEKIADVMRSAAELFEKGEADGSAVSVMFLKSYYEFVSGKMRMKRLKDIVCFEIDSKNCSAVLRCSNFEDAEKMLLPGGKLSFSDLAVLARRDRRAAELKFAYTERYDYIRVAVDETLKGEPMRAFEKAADDYALSRFDDVRYEFQGKIPVILYYLYKTAELKNVRTIMSLKLINCPPEEIKNRLRKGYVG